MIPGNEALMKTSSLRRWCKPRTILVISNICESPARTLEVVSGIRATGARVFLVQLPGLSYSTRHPYLVLDWATRVDQASGDGTHQAVLWAEILSEVTVLKNVAIERVAALAESLGADQVVLTTPTIG